MTKVDGGDLKPSQSNRRSVVPIPSSIHHIPGYPKKLIIFLVAASPFWWTRCWFEGKHHKRSTRTQAKRGGVLIFVQMDNWQKTAFLSGDTAMSKKQYTPEQGGAFCRLNPENPVGRINTRKERRPVFYAPCRICLSPRPTGALETG